MKRYTTERGIEIGITPIPLLLEQVRDAHQHPEPPTYPETTASGAVRQVPMVASEMAAAKQHNPDWYAEHAEVWEAYQVEREKSDAALNMKLLSTVALKAVRVEMPEDDNWVEEQEFLGLEVPTLPIARYIHYVKTEVFGGTKDVVRIMALAAGTEVNEEVLARAESSFRDFLRDNLAAGLADQGGEVAGQPEADAVAGGG